MTEASSHNLPPTRPEDMGDVTDMREFIENISKKSLKTRFGWKKKRDRRIIKMFDAHDIEQQEANSPTEVFPVIKVDPGYRDYNMDVADDWEEGDH